MLDQQMDLRAFLLILFLSPLLLGYNGVEGASWELLEREDMELENQLKLLNKPAVKTIDTEYGDTYDCVDFYKQPAFDHPLLKNHSFHFQMKPTLSLERNKDHVSSGVRESAHIELKGGGCPVGTVPIRRITKEDLIRERNASKLMSFADNTIGAHYAVARTRPGRNKFNGAGARLSVQNPRVSARQYSASRFLLRNGNDAIQAGWRVDPTLYGDTRTRLFIRLDAGQSHCFNTRCPGFVQVRSDIPLDLVYTQVSIRGGVTYEAPLFIDRDLVNGNWWLLVGERNTEVGFWPRRIFSGLADLASYAEWGGEVFYPPGNTPIPEMGSGFPLVGNTKYDAFLRNVEVVDAAGKNINVYNLETFVDDTRKYGVFDIEQTKIGHLVLYGGPPYSF
ncbi:protein neprosin-like [Rhododendron vialii]|uniref:protein neprosin-like n=1 Tax=Rhododendron vialii TaxID=182163 RepID=UPI00265DB105|nr:protein neprosin-like [Rhododendron vialii]